MGIYDDALRNLFASHPDALASFVLGLPLDWLGPVTHSATEIV